MSPLRSLLLHLYHNASRPYRWWAHRRAAAEHRVPVVVLFYHRIADDRATPWTTSNRSFARQIGWLTKHFDMVSLEEAQRRIGSGDNTRPCVGITFDDGYAENCRHAIPLLIKEGVPCTYFVTAHNVVTEEPFAHDLALGHAFAPNDLRQLRAMAGAGIEIGAHGYTHANLDQVTDPDELNRQLLVARNVLQEKLDRTVRYFAFPVGQHTNLTPAAFQMARRAGYQAVCSAYGGYNFPGDDPFHIQRIHGDEELIRLKNRVTVDPRKIHTPRFDDRSIETPCLTAGDY